MEDITQEFLDKQFDEKALQLISNFIEEFDSLFGKYVSKDEVIRRIKENLDKIIFPYKFEKETCQGTYNSEKKEIHLAEISDEELLKSTFFHEMIHCITCNPEKGTTAFSRKFNVLDFEDTRLVTCHGLTEGFTEYVTQKRDEKYAPDLKIIIYPILVEQTGNIVDLVSEEQFLNMAFNNPEKFGQILGLDEYIDEFDLERIYEAFDKIWKEESQIYKEKIIKNTPMGKLLKALNVDSSLIEGSYSSGLQNAKNTILENLTRIMLNKPITTVEEFNNAYRIICRYIEQLNAKKEIQQFEELLAQIKNLQDSGKSMKEILREMTDEARILVQGKSILDEFKLLSKEEQLELLTQESFYDKLVDAQIFDSEFEEDILSEMAGSFINTDSKARDYILFNALRNGLAQIIKDRGYNINSLAIEYVDFKPKNCKRIFGKLYDVFNLYDTKIEKSIYLGSFYNDEDEVIEFLPYSVDKEKIIEKYPQLTESVLLYTVLGDILAYNGDDNYTIIDRDGISIESSRTIYCQSELQKLQERLKFRIEQLQEMTKIPRIPEMLIFKQKKLIQETVKRIKQMENKLKILPEEIKQETGDILLEDMQSFMQKAVAHEEARKDALERGMGYGK